MKTIIKITLALWILSTSAIALETWTNQKGVTVELELVRTFEKDGALAGEFRDKDGQLVIIEESSLVEADAKRLREFITPLEPEIPFINEVISNLRNGKRPTIEEIEKCEAELAVYYDALSQRYGTTINWRFGHKDKVELYPVLVKMALINFPKHGGWPFRSELRLRVAEELKTRTETSDDTFLHFCAIFTSFSKGDLEHAIACYKTVQKDDPFLAEMAVRWGDSQLPNSENKEKFMNAIKEQ